jgi:predicted DNA-binding WGR domain protein
MFYWDYRVAFANDSRHTCEWNARGNCESQQTTTNYNKLEQMKRIFEFADDKSNKFWTIETNGNEFTVTFGKTGTAGQSQTKSFADEAACEKEAEKSIREKTRKGYVEQGEGVRPDVSSKAEKQTEPSAYPEYTAPGDVDLNALDFVVDVNDVRSTGSVLQHHIKNFKKMLANMDGDTMLDYGTVDDGVFTPLANDNSGCSEETFIDAAVTHKELFPLLEQYADLILKATKKEDTSGPWTSEETILGQFLFPALANADKKYLPLLKDFMLSSVEIKCSARFKADFDRQLESIETKYGKDPNEKFVKNFKKWLTKLEVGVDAYLANPGPHNKKEHLKYSPHKMQDVYAYRGYQMRQDDYPVFLEVFKELLTSPKGPGRARLTRNAYHILDRYGLRIPYKNVEQMAADLIEGRPAPSFMDVAQLNEPEWDYWEKCYGVDGMEIKNQRDGLHGITAYGLTRRNMDVKSADGFQRALSDVVDHFDQYTKEWEIEGEACIGWRDGKIVDGWGKKDVSGNTEEFFTHAARYPSLAGIMEKYIVKLTQYNNLGNPLLTSYVCYPYPEGWVAAAVLTGFDAVKYEDVLLQYLKSIPREYWMLGVTMYRNLPENLLKIWKEMGVEPNIPGVKAEFPEFVQ